MSKPIPPQDFARASSAGSDGSTGQAGAERDMIYVLGQPHLENYLDFHQRKVIHEGPIDLRALAAEWQAANDVYAALEQQEAGIADTIECRPLEPDLVPLAAEVEAHRWFRNSFDDLPYSFELVELDKLVISQLQVESGFSRRIAEQLGSNPSAEALFRFCLPLERTLPPCRIRKLSSSRYEFTSYSSDFREHRPQLLRGAALDALALPDPAVALLGIPVGYGSNFLSGIRSGSRVLLENGYHRSFALRSAGFTHAWCVIETVTRKDELRLTAGEDVIADPEFYFAARRPPLLKDFFDPRIARAFRARRSEFVIEVEINVRTAGAIDITNS